MKANRKSKSSTGGIKSGNEMVGPQNRPSGTGYGGSAANKGSGATKNEMRMPANAPGGTGYKGK